MIKGKLNNQDLNLIFKVTIQLIRNQIFPTIQKKINNNNNRKKLIKNNLNKNK